MSESRMKKGKVLAPLASFVHFGAVMASKICLGVLECPLAVSGVVFMQGLLGCLTKKLSDKSGHLDASLLPPDLAKTALTPGNQKPTNFPVLDGWRAQDVALLEYLTLEILELATSGEAKSVITADYLSKVLSDKQKEEDSISTLFSLQDLHKARDGAHCTADNYEESSRAFISLTFSSLVPDLVWNALHARYAGYGGKMESSSEDADEFGEMPYYAHCIVATDANGVEHELSLVVCDGNADANTGIFGYCFTKEGIWARFFGHLAGDCGTLVKATALALARWAPFKEQKPLPEGICWSENSWKFTIEALCFAWAMASRDHAQSERSSYSPPVVGLNRSIVRILGKKIDPRVSPYIWDKISDQAMISFPPCTPALLDGYKNGERDPTALLQLSIAKRGYSKKKEIEFDSTWPAATYNSEKFGFDVDSAAHSNEFSEAAAALEELTFQHHVQLVEEIYAKPRE